ncbi:MAG TPA: peptidase S9 [Candidatus Kapabacteria bacterium]|nr:peptidase S9 [Candidatus Kapabacteria bacterium]
MLFLFFSVAAPRLDAQYFGRNKVHYEDFDFRVMQTEHFDVHYYPEETLAASDGARMAERWYARFSNLFGHEFISRKPLILYANQGDFQQTNVVDELIEEGTGGFTEPLQDRVVLPLTGSYAYNDHVIGHELVHEFQYDIVQRNMGREGLQRMEQLPLWFIEGMAEYLSLGRADPNTTMWMRDAVLQDKVPTIYDVSRDPHYFPYRYGQAIWAYIAGRWGDEIIPRLYASALVVGWEPAIKRQLGMEEEDLSKDWIASLKATYGPQIAARTKPADIGTRLLKDDGDARAMNVSPAVSPDGRYVAFLSSRSLFTIDLYLADAQTGAIITRLLNADAAPHMDALRFINSAGSFSPDGKKFATITYAKGDDEISILDVTSRDVERSIRIKDVGELSNPSWSPDGKQIVFSGSRGGISDLYTIELANRQVHRLTDDRYADMQPSWSPDGKTIAFSTDRGSETDFHRLTYSEMRLALYDLATGTITVLPRFATGKNINPQYSADGKSLYFVADRDGISNLYLYDLAGGDVQQLTNIATGVSGITGGSPAISVARTNGRVMFSAFERGSYVIYWREAPGTSPARGAGTAEGAAPPAVGDSVDRSSGVLPPATVTRGDSSVSSYLRDAVTGRPQDTTFPSQEYSPTLHLSYLGTPVFGASISSFGTYFVGGISAYFSDMLGYNQLAATLQFNGTLEDAGGIVQYMYTKNRWSWGVTAAHIPNVLYGQYTSTTTYEPPGGQPIPAVVYEQLKQSILEDDISLLGAYPFSTTRRFEMSVGYTHVGYSLDSHSQLIADGQIVREVDTSYPAPPSLNLLQTSMAFVGDNSYFGYTSPVSGERFRGEIGGTAGSLKFATLLLDYRKYFFARPVTFAVRGYHYGRYGGDAENPQLNPLFLGYPTNVRGYESSSFTDADCSGGPGCPEYDRLIGSRIALASAEVRVPLFGTTGFGLINFPFLPVDLAAFADGGVAWSAGDGARLEFVRQSTDRIPVFSTGFSARVNLFGYAVVEFYYAYPFQRPNAGWQFGWQISPGW